MKAGRELDRIMAQEVMGWKAAFYSAGGITPYHLTDDPFCPSTEISPAMDILEKLKSVKFEHVLGQNIAIQWLAESGEWWVGLDCSYPEACMISESADTLPHAICLAALKAVGIDTESGDKQT